MNAPTVSRSLRVDGRTLTVSLSPLRGHNGELQWLTRWSPSPPLRMEEHEQHLFSRFRKRAIADISAMLKARAES